MNMLGELPDITSSELASEQSSLAWVGMESIDLPVQIVEPSYTRNVHARVDTQVDLPRVDVKGIHMSRLYRIVDTLTQCDALTPTSLHDRLTQMVTSHEDCGSTNARMRVTFDLLVERPALVTEGLSGWRAYPVVVEAMLLNGDFACQIEVCAVYSSTCPCSAALARQLVEQGFFEAFGTKNAVNRDEVAEWLGQNATLATPHSQRSEAKVSVAIASDATDFGLLALIDRVEAAVGTPVQTAVKRADEQAFAALNGQNLMFVEDAARRIEALLLEYENPRAFVRHIESLHAHDAVAWSDRA